MISTTSHLTGTRPCLVWLATPMQADELAVLSHNPPEHMHQCLHPTCCAQEAHESGVALVVACAQDQAETYVEDLRLNGLISTMEV